MDKKETIKFTRSISCRKYSESFRRKVVDQYLKTGKPKLPIQRDYNIKYKSAINKWLKDFGIADPYVKKAYFADVNISFLKEEKDQKKETLTVTELEAKVMALERKLEDEKILSMTYLRIIEIAEKEYKLAIRKKSNTK